MTFADFAERKTAEALAAVLPPYVTEYERPTADALAIGSDWTRALFDGQFYLSPVPPSRPACNLVFVESRDGNTGAADPAELGGGETDKHLVYEGLSRVAADAVMAGAATVRGGSVVFSVWHPELVALRTAYGKPRHPINIVATVGGLDLDRGVLFNSPEVRVVIISVGVGADSMRDGLARRPWIRTVVVDHPRELSKAFAALAALGVERLSCVGGRRIATALIDAGLVDDIYLTTSARDGGEPHTPMYRSPLPRHRQVVKKQGTGAERGVLFRHLAFR